MRRVNKSRVEGHCGVDVEIDLLLSIDGIEASAFLGNTDEPQIKGQVPFKVLIDESLDVLVFGGWREAYEDVAEFVSKLKSLHEYAEKRVKELGWEVET